MTYEIVVTNSSGISRTLRIEVETQSPPAGDGKLPFRCRVNGNVVASLDAMPLERDLVSLLFNGQSYEARRDLSGNDVQIVIRGERFNVEIRDPRSLRARRKSGAAVDGPKKITAPMPGKVVRILAQEGAQVEAGQGVIVIEAMKMQNELKSPKKGVVKKIAVSEGATVNPGDVLGIIE